MNRMRTLVLGGTLASVLAGCASAGTCPGPDVEVARAAAAAAVAHFFLDVTLLFLQIFAHCH